MAVRKGTGAVVKFFKDDRRGDTMQSVMAEVSELTDADLADLVKGLSDGSLTY